MNLIKLPKSFIKKILIGAVLVSLALVLTYLIKESLDTQSPENALPTITVSYEGSPIPDVYRSGYEWSFFTTREQRNPIVAVSDMPLLQYDVQADKEVTISFSSKPSSLRVWRAVDGTNNYTEIALENGAFKTPSTPGMYVYHITAEWVRGYVEYYFKLDIEKQ